MQTITFTCETITPMFLSGADGQTPELRPPSIKGALRFWWRAMNGHLVEKKKDKSGTDYWDYSKLKEQEALIFGGTEPAQRSRVIVRCEQGNFNIAENKYRMIAHKGSNSKCFETTQEICITLGLTQNINLGNDKVFNLDMLKALFEVFCYLGGLGKRNRRGNGGFKITKYKIKINDTEQEYIYNQLDFGTTLVDKLNLVCLDNRTVFRFDGISKINSTFSITNQPIPYIVCIEKIIKHNNVEKNRELISKSTHNILLANGLANGKTIETKSGTIAMKDRGGLEYTKYIGSGSPRFASPMMFSILNEQEIVVTTLKTIKEISGRATIINTSLLSIQNDLINEVKTII
jgi:CRISPR type III-B/RAMP module RAMP protein Cmr1